nr:hypothetical protein [Micromonospora sp. DSM 115978]
MTNYQSRAAAEADAAYALLGAHVPDPETGNCRICRIAGPCQPANAAVNRLVELNRPLLRPSPDPDRRRNMWRGWLRPYLGRREVQPNVRPMPERARR